MGGAFSVNVFEKISLWLRARVASAPVHAVLVSPLFEEFSSSEVQLVLRLGRIVEMKKDAWIVRQGDYGASMFMVLNGAASVELADLQLKGPCVMQHIVEGDVFGEVSVVDPGLRSAGVKAETAIRLIEYDETALRKLQDSFPRIACQLCFNIARILAQRLAATNTKIGSACRA